MSKVSYDVGEMNTTVKEKAVLRYYSQCSIIYRELRFKMRNEKRAHKNMDLSEFREMLPEQPSEIMLDLFSERDRELLRKIYECLEVNFARISDEWIRVLLFRREDPIKFCVSFTDFSDENLNWVFWNPERTFVLYDPWEYHRDHVEVIGKLSEIRSWIIQASRFMVFDNADQRRPWENYCKILSLLTFKPGERSLLMFPLTGLSQGINAGCHRTYNVPLAQFLAKAICKGAYPWA
jgi:hypothetical protein